MDGSPPCDKCTGLCCTAKATWTSVPLTNQEAIRPRFAPIRQFTFVRGSDRPIYVMNYVDGACQFLDRLTKRCTIYHERPQVCRDFDCRKDKTPAFIRRNPQMKQLIKDAL